MAITTDRRQGVNSSAAVKVPCRCATTSAITLNGLQTVDGVALAADDRVLVKDQSTASQNGIYSASTGSWQRAADFDGALDVKRGTLAVVHSGTVNGSSMWQVTSSDPVVIGTSEVSFALIVVDSVTSLDFIQSGTGAVTRNAQDKMRDIVSVKDFGAVGDGTTDDTAAITDALSSGSVVYFPAGAYLFSSLTIPAGSKGILGNSSATVTLLASHIARSANDNIVYYSGSGGLSIDGVTLDLQYSEFSDTYGIRINSASDVSIRHFAIIGTAKYGIYITDCENVTVDQWSAIGNTGGFESACFALSGTQSNKAIHVRNGRVSGTFDNAAGMNGCYESSIRFNRCEGTGTTGFSFSLNKCFHSDISHNYSKNSENEAFQLTDTRYCTIALNHAEWDNSSGDDFGISIDGTAVGGFTLRFNKVIGNTIRNSYKSGLACANYGQYNLLADNVLYDAGVRFGDAAITCYVSDYASATSYGNSFLNNVAINEAGSVDYFVRETTGGGSMSIDSNNYNGNIFAGTVDVARYSLVGANSKFQENEWINYGPSITPATGSLTSTTINSARYKVDGKLINVQFDVTITDNGTGAGNISVGLPITADTNGGGLCGREIAISGKTISGQASGAAVTLTNYDNSYPGGTNARLVVSGIYRAA